MWKARYEAELAAERLREDRRAAREFLRGEWHAAWRDYEVHWREGLVRGALQWPKWWQIRRWLQLLLGKDLRR